MGLSATTTGVGAWAPRPNGPKGRGHAAVATHTVPCCTGTGGLAVGAHPSTHKVVRAYTGTSAGVCASTTMYQILESLTRNQRNRKSNLSNATNAYIPLTHYCTHWHTGTHKISHPHTHTSGSTIFSWGGAGGILEAKQALTQAVDTHTVACTRQTRHRGTTGRGRRDGERNG